MGNGCMGKALHVDLSAGEIREETVPDQVYRTFLSGVGLGAHMLFNRVPAGADPLGPDNMLGFVSGMLTGAGSLFTGRWMAVGKSPLTGGWGEANCGGTFSPAIKRCGYDGIFFTGISEKPVYLNVEKGKAELRDASDLWGKDTKETEEILIGRASGKKKPKVACIGPAGEKLSLIAGIANDGGRMAARSGLGAVMGSKKLKALSLSGTRVVEPFDREEMKRLSKMCDKWVRFQPPFIPGPMTAHLGKLLRVLPFQMVQDGLLYKVMLRKWGTVSMNQAGVEMGDAPVKNWGGCHEDYGVKKSRAVNPDAIVATEFVKYHCYSCPLGCGGLCLTGDKTGGKFSETHKPEYETVTALGALCLNDDLDSIFYLNELLNRAGMDTISAGAAVAFAIECYENAVITKKDTRGLELTWGNADAVVTLIEQMIRREGLGDILADGVKRAAERLGPGARRYAVHAGGQELPMHDGRNDPGFNLHYTADPAPGRHTTGAQLYYEMHRLWKKVKNKPRPGLFSMFYGKDKKYDESMEKAAMGVACSEYAAVLNGAGACLFAAFMGAKRFPLFDWLNASTGWDLSPEDYMEAGRRIQTLRQAFNAKHGVAPKDVGISRRAAGFPPLKKGANKERTADPEKTRRNYWKLFGWDPETGIPPDSLIEKMRIDENTGDAQ